MPRSYTTQQVADAVGVTKKTILRWLRNGKIREPRRVGVKGTNLRIWSERDLKVAKEHKRKFYWEGRGIAKKKRR